MLRLSRRTLCSGPSRTRLGAAARPAAAKAKDVKKSETIADLEKKLDAGKAVFDNYRVHNFSAGPAAIPMDVLSTAQRDLLNFKGLGIGFMELSLAMRMVPCIP